MPGPPPPGGFHSLLLPTLVSILPAALSSVRVQGSLGAIMERSWSCGGAVFRGEWALQAVALGLSPPPRW